MPCHCKQLLACTSWLAVASLLLGCAAQPLPDCRLPETCPPLEILPDPEPVLQSSSHPAQLAAQVSVDLTSPPRNISDSLFGLFFEEIFHGGEGGIYAELIQDRGFEGLAYASGYATGQLEAKDMTHFLHEWPFHMAVESTDPRSWAIGSTTKASISRQGPRDRGNPTYITIHSSERPARLSNHGFWGIPVQKGAAFKLSLYLRARQGCKGEVEVALGSADSRTFYARTSFAATGNWTHHTASLTSDTEDPKAMLVIQAPANCSLDVDLVSLFPGENGLLGAKTPFRADLLELMKGLHPSFIRLPGGCYVEGTRMSNAYLWKPSVGPMHQRPGHWNGQWKYWSTDGLGLYEYMLLAEAIQAQPIWIINNGIAHEDAVPTSRIGSMVQDALDALEFIMGPSDSPWGAVRASMGHPEPWSMHFLGVGNEDCGKQFYTGNYLAFYRAIKQAWPHLQLIANCDMGGEAPTDIYDWHWYTAAGSIFHARATFDAIPRGPDAPKVFASEYAVFDWGRQPFVPYGNMEDAVGEAGFMTGLEQNADAVRMAAFAPMLTNVQHHPGLAPNTLISFDGTRAAVSPSYHVQALFAEHAGAWLAHSSVNLSVISDLAVSVTCSDHACKQMACKMANWGFHEQRVKLLIQGAEAHGLVNITTLASPHRLDTNSLDEPDKVVPVTRSAPLEQLADFYLPAASLTVLVLQTTLS